MSTSNPAPRVVKQAIHWMLKLRESGNSPKLQQQCEQWRSDHHEHELAWQRVLSLHQELNLRAIPGAGVALQTLETSQQRLHRRQALKLLGTAALLGGAAWLGKDTDAVSAWTSDYASATGERRRVHLPDGSLLQLNTHSAVDLVFDDRQRLIRLKQGEIMLTCAEGADTAPPLRVQTRDGLLEGSSGRFGVRQNGDCTQVSVNQGQVALHRPGTAQLQWIAAGQTYRLAASGARLLEHANMDPSAWTDGLIVTRDMRLADFLTEVGRYRQGLLGCDADIAELRLSGVFRLEDTDKLLQLLPQTLPVRVTYHTRWWIRLERLA